MDFGVDNIDWFRQIDFLTMPLNYLTKYFSQYNIFHEAHYESRRRKTKILLQSVKL